MPLGESALMVYLLRNNGSPILKRRDRKEPLYCGKPNPNLKSGPSQIPEAPSTEVLPTLAKNWNFSGKFGATGGYCPF